MLLVVLGLGKDQVTPERNFKFQKTIQIVYCSVIMVIIFLVNLDKLLDSLGFLAAQVRTFGGAMKFQI